MSEQLSAAERGRLWGLALGWLVGATLLAGLAVLLLAL